MKSSACCAANARRFVSSKPARSRRRLAGKIAQSSTAPRQNDFYPVYRDQYNPDLTVPDSVVEEWIAVGTFRAKEKITIKPQVVYDWSFAERARR